MLIIILISVGNNFADKCHKSVPQKINAVFSVIRFVKRFLIITLSRESTIMAIECTIMVRIQYMTNKL